MVSLVMKGILVFLANFGWERGYNASGIFCQNTDMSDELTFVR